MLNRHINRDSSRCYTHIDIMYEVFLLVDFVGLYTVLFGQPKDAVLSWSNIGPTQIDPFSLLVLRKTNKIGQNTNKVKNILHKMLIDLCCCWKSVAFKTLDDKSSPKKTTTSSWAGTVFVTSLLKVTLYVKDQIAIFFLHCILFLFSIYFTDSKLSTSTYSPLLCR